MPDFSRGEVYYVYPSYAEVGSEQWSGRPAVVVSADVINRHSQCVEVVYLTTRPKSDYPTHVLINATGRPSTAICEQITSVDKSRLNDCYGRCTPKEMSQLDEALRVSLGLPRLEEMTEAEEENASSGPLREGAPRSGGGECDPGIFAETELRLDLARAEAALDAYRSLCDNLLDRLGCVCASA